MEKTGERSVQSLILMPFIAEAAALHPEAVSEVDRQYAAGNFHDHAIPEGEKTFYRNFFEWNDPVNEYDCRRALSPLLEISEGVDQKSKVLSGVKEVMKKGWPMIYQYIESKNTPVPFESFWIEKILRRGSRPSAKEIQNLPAVFQRDKVSLHPAPRHGLPHTAPALSKKIMAYLFDARLPDVKGNPADPVQWRSGQVRRKKLLDGDFPAFLYICMITNKKIQDQNPTFAGLFSAQMNKQNRMRYGSIEKTVTPDQKKLGEEIWGRLKERMHGFPETLEEYFLSEAGKKRRFWPSYSGIPGIPANLFNEQRVEEKAVKKWIFSMAAHVPPHEEITEQLLDEAEFFWMYLMVLSVCGQACGSTREKTLQRLGEAAVREEKALACIENSGPDIRCRMEAAEKDSGQLKNELEQVKRENEKLKKQYKMMEEKAERRAAELEAELDGVIRSGEEDSAIPSDRQAADEAERASLAEKKIIFVGGMPALRQQLKTDCPGMICIGPDDSQFDGHILRGADLVVIYWKYMGHSLFHRVSALAGRYGVPLIFACASHEGRLLYQISRAAARKAGEDSDGAEA